MDSKTIYEGMTKGAVSVMDAYSVVIQKELGYISIADTSVGHIDTGDPLPDEECTANAHAITLAVNNTFGAGIDPCKVGEMYEMLERIVRQGGFDGDLKEAQHLLTVVKLKQ